MTGFRSAATGPNPGFKKEKQRSGPTEALRLPLTHREGVCRGGPMTPGQTRIRDLELLLVLTEEGNMTRAATRVGISEPALSKQLRKLEQRLRLKLFERGNGGMVTTASGQAFVTHAYDCFHAFHRAVNEAHDCQFGEQHRLRIGASSYLSNGWLERLQSVEFRSHRKVSIEMVTGFTFDMLARLRSGEIDVSLVESPPGNAVGFDRSRRQ